MDMSLNHPPIHHLPIHHLGVMHGARFVCDPKRPAVVHAMVAHGVMRFDELVAAFPVARNILSSRLRAMMDDGLVDKVPQGNTNGRFFYLPTEKARALGAVILSASTVTTPSMLAAPTTRSAFGDHDHCGRDLHPVPKCKTCVNAGGAASSVHLDPWACLANVTPAEVSSWFSDGVGETLAVINDRWSARIMACLFHVDDDGTPDIDTFDELVNHLGIARNILAARLKELTAAGYVVRALYQTKPQRFRYQPSPAADRLRPFLAVLGDWGRQWCLPTGASTARLRHAACVSGFEAVVCCGSCLAP